MTHLNVALVQVNPTVGALQDNAAMIVERAREAAAAGAALLVFPELALPGYPPEDLILRQRFLADCEERVAQIAAALPNGCAAVLGSPTPTPDGAFNSAKILANGAVVGAYHKMLLPNYGVFDEKRVFVAGRQAVVLDVGGMRVGIHVCEDSWVHDAEPCRALRDAGLDLLINLSASPYHRGKVAERQRVLAATARELQTTVAYTNLVGGQDELIFDGSSMVVDATGRLIARARAFAEDVLHLRLRGETVAPATGAWETITVPNLSGGNDGDDAPRIEPLHDDLRDVYEALTLGLRDYTNKNGFAKVIVALSGGIDSALVAALAVDALGADRVTAVTLPSQHSSDETLADARALARNLGIDCPVIPIKNAYDSYLDALQPLWSGRDEDTTEENLQARIRGNIVMALSNKFGWLVLTTGNKSELATGYCTLYGDMCGGLAVIKDVPKLLVFELCRWRNEQGEHVVIPPSTIERPPSAELRPDQRDTDSLPPYEELDPIIERYVERDWEVDEIIADGFDAATVKRIADLIDVNEYKRRQGAPGLKITPKAFGRDRRLSITNRYRYDRGNSKLDT